MKAKVAFLHKPFDLRVEEVEVPALKDNQVLVQVGACGICGSDVECFEGKSKEGRYDIAPYTPGHEWGGKIAAVARACIPLTWATWSRATASWPAASAATARTGSCRRPA